MGSKPQNDAVLEADAIVAISPAREKFFGCSGRMLLPGRATVEAPVRKIPAHSLLTTDLLCKELAEQFQVEAVCPVTTTKALQAIANDTESRGANGKVAYWRVIKKNGELIAKFPGGVEGQGAHLRQEGFTLDTGGKVPKVDRYKEYLAALGS